MGDFNAVGILSVCQMLREVANSTPVCGEEARKVLHIKSASSLVALVAAQLLMANAAQAQTAEAADETSSGIEEIIVTAQKRSENVQDVPSAVAAFSGAQLQERGVGSGISAGPVATRPDGFAHCRCLPAGDRSGAGLTFAKAEDGWEVGLVSGARTRKAD